MNDRSGDFQRSEMPGKLGACGEGGFFDGSGHGGWCRFFWRSVRESRRERFDLLSGFSGLTPLGTRPTYWVRLVISAYGEPERDWGPASAELTEQELRLTEQEPGPTEKGRADRERSLCSQLDLCVRSRGVWDVGFLGAYAPRNPTYDVKDFPSREKARPLKGRALRCALCRAVVSLHRKTWAKKRAGGNTGPF